MGMYLVDDLGTAALVNWNYLPNLLVIWKCPARKTAELLLFKRLTVSLVFA